MKACTKCNIIQDLNHFSKDVSQKDSLNTICKICRNYSHKQWSIKNKHHIQTKSVEYRKNMSEDLKQKKKIRSKLYYEKNKDIYLKKRRDKYAVCKPIRNKEKNKIAAQKFYQNNKKKFYEYFKKRMQTNSTFKLTTKLRGRVTRYLKLIGKTKKLTFSQYIGCSPSELRLHIESKFLPGMTWENHKYNGWHIDHIIPLSSGKTEDDFYKLCHYTNLQPLWAIDNFKKGKKIL